MIKVLYLVYVCCLSPLAVVGGQIGRVMTVSRVRAPTSFRPGVTLNRPWGPPPPRLAQAASHRAPYILYRSPGHRYVRPYSGTRYMSNPWRTTMRVPPMSSAVTPEYEFVRAASVTPSIVLHTNGGTGAIHTIPAPNLSLSQKPIVVMDGTDDILASHSTSNSVSAKPMYQISEKISEGNHFKVKPNVAEAPNMIGFSKATSLTSPEINAMMKNGGAIQLAAEYGMPTIGLPQTSFMPQQFTVQGFNSLLQDPIHNTMDGNILSQNLMFQPDSIFLQKLQNQLHQRYPGVEFLPYYQPEPEFQPQVYVVEAESNNKNTIADHKNIVRETQESAVVTLVPQTIVIRNITESQPLEVKSLEVQPIEVKTEQEPENVTLAIVTSESQPPTTTLKYIVETTTEEQKTTPIYYAQIGQSVDNVVANGFYSAINDVRAAAALAQVEKPEEEPKADNITQTTTTTIKPDLKPYFITSPVAVVPNQTFTELKPIHGVPFTKVEPVNVAYTLLRADDTKPKPNKDGAVYAGQIVEASISEDQDFNKEKANMRSRHPPLRLYTVTENKEVTSAPPKLTVVKAKIPPKSKLTFDDETGEPVLRIYASYVDSPLHKEIIASKLANIKHVKEVVVRKQDSVDSWKSGTIKNLDKRQSGSDVNQVTEFGLKLRPRMDQYPSIFEDYEE